MTDNKFNIVVDKNGVEKKYPTDDKVVFFDCVSRYFIYALYTNEDLTGRDLIEVNKDTFIKHLSDRDDPIVIFVDSFEEMQSHIKFAEIKSVSDELPLGAFLNLE